MNFLWPVFSCFFCGVDSKAVILFFVIFVVCVVGGGLLFLVWSICKGDYRNIEKPKYEIFEAEKRK